MRIVWGGGGVRIVWSGGWCSGRLSGWRMCCEGCVGWGVGIVGD